MLILLTNVFLYFVVRHRDEILRITSLEHPRGGKGGGGLSKFAYSLVNAMITVQWYQYLHFVNWDGSVARAGRMALHPVLDALEG